MKKVLTLAALATLAAGVAGAQTITKNWEELCGVNTAANDVRAMAINPTAGWLTTINRQATGTADIKLFNLSDGQPFSTASLDQTGIPTGTYALVSVEVSADGAIFACSLSYLSTTSLNVYYWANASAAPVQIYTSGAGAWLGYRMGDAMDVRGSVSDNSVKVVITGNNAASLPLVLTTADNGANWTPTSLTNAVQAQDLHLNADGSFYGARFAGADAPTKFAADGTAGADIPYVTGALPVNPPAYAGFAANEAEDLFFGVGIRDSAIVAVTDASGTLVAQSPDTDLIDLGAFTAGIADGSGAVELVQTGEDYEIYVLSERNGVAKYTLDMPAADVSDWHLMGR